MGACEATKKHDKPKNEPQGAQNVEQATPEVIAPSKPVNIPKYSEEEKRDQLRDLHEATSQKQLGDAMHSLSNKLQRLLTKVDLNIACFVKSLPVEAKAGKSDQELINEFESKKDDLKTSFKNDAKTSKTNILNDHSHFSTYKDEFDSAKEKLKPVIKILSQYKENLIFQILCNHSVIFEEIARKLEEEDAYSFLAELRTSIVELHTIFFAFFDYEDAETLEKTYFNYVNEEFKLFSIFYKEENQF